MTHDPRSVLTRPAPAPDRTARYGDHPEHVVDLRLPARDAGHPLVIFIHGGFWRVEYDRTHAGPLAADLARRGWPVATVEFRRIGQDGGGWPGTFEDVAAAVAAVPRLFGADVPEGLPLLAGHSAGGQLALWAAARSPGLTRGVLALAAVADLRTAHAQRLGGGAVAALLGGGPADVPDRYAAADPMALLPLRVRSVLVHGEDDDRVPVALSTGFAAAAGAAGDQVRVVTLPGADHFAVIDPESAAWPAVLAALEEISALEETCGPGPKAAGRSSTPAAPA